MSITLNGSTQYVSVASSIISGYPFTLFAHFNPTVTNVAQYMVHFDNSASSIVNGWRLRAAGDVGGPPVRGTTGDGSTTEAITSGNFSAGTWQKAMFVGISATSREVYYNNGNLGTGTNNLTPTGLNRMQIGATALLGVISGFFNGSLAHIAIWNKALGVNARAMLQFGYSPKLVETPSLVAYCPMFTSVADLWGATAWAGQASPTFGADSGIKFNNGMMTMGMT